MSLGELGEQRYLAEVEEQMLALLYTSTHIRIHSTTYLGLKVTYLGSKVTYLESKVMTRASALGMRTVLLMVTSSG